jgi:hypothetical protein
MYQGSMVLCLCEWFLMGSLLSSVFMLLYSMLWSKLHVIKHSVKIINGQSVRMWTEALVVHFKATRTCLEDQKWTTKQFGFLVSKLIFELGVAWIHYRRVAILCMSFNLSSNLGIPDRTFWLKQGNLCYCVSPFLSHVKTFKNSTKVTVYEYDNKKTMYADLHSTTLYGSHQQEPCL